MQLEGVSQSRHNWHLFKVLFVGRSSLGFSGSLTKIPDSALVLVRANSLIHDKPHNYSPQVLIIKVSSEAGKYPWEAKFLPCLSSPLLRTTELESQ